LWKQANKAVVEGAGINDVMNGTLITATYT